MQSLREWCFTFNLAPKYEPDGLVGISEKLIDEAIGWAEQRGLGIGGGYKTLGKSDSQKTVFNFGLTITVDGQSISHQTAADLFAHLKSAEGRHGFTMNGGFAEFEK